MTTGLRIKEARRQAGFTQTALGNALGISGSMIAQYETGRRNPKLETIQRISAILQLPLSFFQATPPFEDLEFLEKHKTAILLTLCKNGLFDLSGRELDDVSNYEFWKIVEKNIISIELRDDNALSFHYRISPSDAEFTRIVEEETQNIYLDAIRRGFQKLNGAGQQRVADFAVDLADDLAKIPQYQRSPEDK